MPTPEKKSISKSVKLTANQKISEALSQATQALSFDENIGDNSLRKALRSFVKVKKLSIPELENELIDALCNVETAAKKIEIYEAALSIIKEVNVAETVRPKGGRPKNPWAEVAHEQAKLHLKEKDDYLLQNYSQRIFANMRLVRDMQNHLQAKRPFLFQQRRTI